MKILALDYSSNRRSVALVSNGEVVAGCFDEGHGGTQSQAMVAGALGSAGWKARDVEGVAVGVGPGSYTGIRMAIAIAQGWALAFETPVYAVSSFAAIAWRLGQTGRGGRMRLAAYAQRGEFVTTWCEAGEADCQLTLNGRDEVEAWIREGVPVVSPDDRDRPAGAAQLLPEAGWVGALVTGALAPTPAEELAPVYLRKAEFIKAPPARIVE